MPIVALPPAAVRSIGSTTAISDSVSVVKELVDNALDARASSVAVEVSVNALDVIQVKDNGHGIAPPDRDLVCHRHCTSKVRDFEDVMNVGGTSLGFRGEALASIVEMSRNVVISTRIEGEAVAVSLKIDREGDIVSQDRISHPLGTTVRVVDFLDHLPVRKQTALKASAKIHSKIKSTLQAYALARPAVRLSLKVLKARNEKGNWTYAPTVGATLWDAAMKILDSRAVTQCFLQTWTSSRPVDSHVVVDDGNVSSNDSFQYKLEAILPRPGSDIKDCNRIGQFVSLDSRQVSCARGTLKACIDLYKSYLQASRFSENQERLVDPLLCMSITCSRGAYDANVEPAKDDVLFTDSRGFLDAVESFFRDIYGELGDSSADEGPVEQQHGKQKGFELLLNRNSRLSVANCVEVSISGEVEKSFRLVESTPQGKRFGSRNESTQSPPRKILTLDPPAFDLVNSASDQDDSDPRLMASASWQPNMRSEKTDFFGPRNFVYPDPTLTFGTEEEALRDVDVSNPWTIAKANAPIRRLPANQQSNASTYHNGQLFIPARQKGEPSSLGVSPGRGNYPDNTSTPGDVPHVDLSYSRESSADEQHSPQDQFTFPLRAWNSGERHSDTNRRSKSTPESSPERPLDRWVRRDQMPLQDIVPSPAFSILGTPSSDIPQITQRSRRITPRKPQDEKKSINQPFKPPLLEANRIRLDAEAVRRPLDSQAQLSWANSATTTPQESENTEPLYTERFNEATSSKPIHPDLALTLDYERRKQAATQQRQQYLLRHAQVIESGNVSVISSSPKQAPPSLSNSPYKNRYNKAVAALSPSKDTTTATTTTATAAEPPHQRQSPSVFRKGDPREYFLRHYNQQHEHTASPSAKNGSVAPMHKLKRLKTSLLPLETTPTDCILYDVVCSLPVEQGKLATEMTALASVDKYIRTGKNNAGFYETVNGDADGDVASLEKSVREIVKKKYRRNDGAEVRDWEVKIKDLK